MNQSEQFCLKWNNFQENVCNAFSSMRKSDDFADVTFICEDEKQVKAHKVILGALSPFLNNILTKNKHVHPLIYMRGTTLDDLVSVLDFMYDGQANVFQQNIESFLALGNELKLKGLTDLPNKTSEDIPEVRQKGDKIQKSYLQIGVGETNPPDKYKSEEFINENDLISISDVHERTVAVSDDYQFSNINKLTQKQYFGTGNMCLLCDKVFFNTGNQIKHIKKKP